jgi:hypothetical protein
MAVPAASGAQTLPVAELNCPVASVVAVAVAACAGVPSATLRPAAGTLPSVATCTPISVSTGERWL